jgi:hypothetical protein
VPQATRLVFLQEILCYLKCRATSSMVVENCSFVNHKRIWEISQTNRDNSPALPVCLFSWTILLLISIWPFIAYLSLPVIYHHKQAALISSEGDNFEPTYTNTPHLVAI